MNPPAVLSGRAAFPLGRLIDVAVCAVLIAFGVVACGLVRPESDFSGGDVTYYELARSMIEGGAYGFDSQPAVYPPGFPAVLALLCATIGCGHPVLIRFTIIGATLSFLVSYELLRREQGRAVAAVGCLLLASCPDLFRHSTTTVMSDVPYFFVSLAALAVGARLQAARGAGSRAVWLIACAVSLAAAILLRSAGIALALGLAAWLAASFAADRAAARARLRLFLPVLAAGLLAQGAWAHWSAAHQDVEWPMVGGWPRPYVAQLAVRSGNQPELGMATLRDIPARVARNAEARGTAFMELFTHRDGSYFAPLAPAIAALVLVGLWSSMRTFNGWPAWYFAVYEGMYWLWPWDLEFRFILPVAPLALLYAVRGGQVVGRVAARRPRAIGVWGIALTAPAAVCAMAILGTTWSWRLLVGEVACGLAAAIAGWVAWTGSLRPPAALAPLLARAVRPVSVGGVVMAPLALAGLVALAGTVSLGVIREVKIAEANLAGDLAGDPGHRDVRAGKWIRDHTPGSAVIMARQLDVVYHYARRRVVWFPPLSDPRQLMDGILAHRVDFVVVTDRDQSYWRPDEGSCFEPLLEAYPRSFSLAYAQAGFRIFAVHRAARSGPAG